MLDEIQSIFIFYGKIVTSLAGNFTMVSKNAGSERWCSDSSLYKFSIVDVVGLCVIPVLK